MPGIIGPSRGGVTTAAVVSKSVRGRNNLIPEGIKKLTPAQRIKFLMGLGYALNPKSGWGPRAEAAWKNMLAARDNDVNPQNAASFWSKNSPLSADRDPLHVDLTGSVAPAPKGATGPSMKPSKGKPVKTQGQDTPAIVTSTAPGMTAPPAAGIDPGSAFTQPLTAQQQKLLGKLLGAKLPVGQKVNPQQLVKMLGPNLSDDLISSLSGKDDIDRSINFLQSLVSKHQADAAQHQKNIDSWYQEVGNSLATAASRDKAINAATSASIQDASRGIISALGGEANQGSGMAAQAGQQGVDLASALGQANEEYNSDVAPLIQMEAAGAKSQAAQFDQAQTEDLQREILDQQTARDTALANARVQLAQINAGLDQNRAQTLLSGIQANNEIGQQNYANKLSQAQSILAAMGFGLNVANLGASINNNVARVNATNAATLQRGIKAQNDAAQKAAAARAKQMAKKNAPLSQSDLRQAEKQANLNLGALQQQGQIEHNVQGAIQAVKSAYNINAYSNRAARQAAYQSAIRHLPNVKVDPRWFGLGGY